MDDQVFRWMGFDPDEPPEALTEDSRIGWRFKAPFYDPSDPEEAFDRPEASPPFDTVNISIPREGMFAGAERTSALEETWWVWREEPGMDQIKQQAGDSLDEMFARYKLYPVKIDGEYTLYQARFEFPQYDRAFQFPEALIGKGDSSKGAIIGFIDFLTGFPLACTEILMMVGEYSSKNDLIAAYSDPDSMVAPIPDEFFEGYDKDKTLLNYIYFDTEFAETWADDLMGEPKPKGLRWWVRVNIRERCKYPLPGEFVALGNRMFPDKPCDMQESSPFLFSGNWMDTVFYTSAVVREIIEGEDFTRYLVQWRNKYLIVTPTDFAEYRVGDRVTIIKNVPNDEKQSQLWKDDDTKEFDDENWIIAPITFYELEN